MEADDFRYERLTAALLARQTRLRLLLAQVNEGMQRDRCGRAPFSIQGAERGRVEDELAYISDALALAAP